MAPARKPTKPKKEVKPEVSSKKAVEKYDYRFLSFVVIYTISIIIIVAGVWYFFFRGEDEGAPEFEVSNLTFSPSEVEAGEPVIISAMVKNVGDLEGTYTIELKIDGEIQETKGVTLAGGATETVSFMVTRDTSGTYTIGVNGLQRALNVLTPATGNIWVNIWNEDYAFHNVIVLLDNVEIAREDHFANAYWKNFLGGFEVTGTYELKIKVEWFEASAVWSSLTFIDTVGDEPTHWYYGITAIVPAGSPNTYTADGVWTRDYFIKIQEGDIGLHY